jgi:hypothetical protein
MRDGGSVPGPDAANLSPVLAPEAAYGMVCRQLMRVSSPDAGNQ